MKRTKQIHPTKDPISKRVKGAVKFLSTRIGFLEPFTNFEDFILHGSELDENKTKAIEYHLWVVRDGLARILWRNEVFIGINVIDQLIFDLLRSGKGSDLASEFFNLIQELGLHREGFVLFPLHSFGVLGLGFYRFVEKASPNMILGDTGLAITAQTNSEEQTIEFLNSAKAAFGIKQNIPVDLVQHFTRSRSLHWTVRNPLLAVRIRSFSGTYYENQFIYTLKLRLSTALIMMLSALENRPDTDSAELFSSSRWVNNFQTLDIRHYLTFETPAGKGKDLSVRCVPMNVSPLELARLSDLDVEVDPRYWMKSRAKIRLEKLISAIAKIEHGYLKHVILGSNDPLQQRVYGKLLISIDAFRQSFSVNARQSDATISLAIAFESLLIDSYSRGIVAKLKRRVELCLYGQSGARRYQDVIAALYSRRSEIVHLGSTKDFEDMAVAHRVYVLCLQHIVSQLENLPRVSGKPIGDILGD